MTVAMDANALMMPVETGVRLFDEIDRLLGSHDCVVPESVLDELESLSHSDGEEGRAASVGMDLAADCETVDTDAQYADDALYELATAGEVEAVVTNDAPLRERLLDAGVPVIHLRGRNKLTRTQP
ncbi:MAG: PIN domain-containing protein [Halodesulfurarchaeum sp.]